MQLGKLTRTVAAFSDFTESKMSNLTTKQTFSLTPASLTEAMAFAKTIADSDLAPKDYKGKAGNVLVAMQMGFEVGLQPMQAIQNIAVINGRPSVWGDAALALVLASPLCEDVIETKIENGYSCTAIRKGQEPRTRTFTIEEAKRAGLWGKPGPWTNYPERMLQMRARGFALRDKFADVLKGLILAEEAMDIPQQEKFMGDVELNSQPTTSRTEALKAKLLQSKKMEEAKIYSPTESDKDGLIDISDAEELNENIVANMISLSKSDEDLKIAADFAAKLEDAEAKKRLRSAFKAKKSELENPVDSEQSALDIN